MRCVTRSKVYDAVTRSRITFPGSNSSMITRFSISETLVEELLRKFGHFRARNFLALVIRVTKLPHSLRYSGGIIGLWVI